jgi:phosphatidylglycerol:prolipoprotein diacylglycerol transferase
MNPGINIGPIHFPYYGMILMLGAVAAAWLAEREARRRQLNGELVWDGLIWVLIGGIVGARIWHILTPPQSMQAAGITTHYYLTHPLDMLMTWRGGLGIPGAVIGGVLALYFFTRNRKLVFPVWLDIVAPALALGQAIGRWGNYVNQELYGAPTTLPWGITIANAPGYPPGTKFHPLFLYESIWDLLNLALLLYLGRRHSERLKAGDLFLIYLIVYPVGRFFLEFLRLDTSLVGGINANQVLMAVVTVLAAAALIWRHRRSDKMVQVEEDAGSLENPR